VVNVWIGLVASVEDASLVVVPGGGVDADGDGADSRNRFDEGRIDVGWENRVVNNFGLKRGLRGRKRALLIVALVRGVRIGPFGSDATGLDELIESDLSGAPAAAASAAALERVRRAIQNLLFREVLQIAVSESPERFDRLSGRERPARAALSLVFDGSQDGGKLLSPVDASWKGGEATFVFVVDIENILESVRQMESSFVRSGAFARIGDRFLVTKETMEFLLSSVREMINTSLPGVVRFFVVFDDRVKASFKDRAPEVELLFGFIVLVVFEDIFLKSVPVIELEPFGLFCCDRDVDDRENKESETQELVELH